MPDLFPTPFHPTLRPDVHRQLFLPRLPLLGLDLFLLLVPLDHTRCESGSEVGCVKGVKLREEGWGYLRGVGGDEDREVGHR